MSIKNKCYKCENRCVGCHSKCKDYKEFKEALDVINNKKKEDEKIDRLMRRFMYGKPI